MAVPGVVSSGLWVLGASWAPLGKPQGLPRVFILACTAPGCPAEVPVIPDPCWQQERWPVKVACGLPAVHGCSALPCSARRAQGLCQGVSVPGDLCQGGSLCQGSLCQGSLSGGLYTKGSL